MKKRMKQIIATIMTVAMLLNAAIPVYAGGTITFVSDPSWLDENRKLTVGDGPIFSDVHPEITDPEYYIKEYYAYPGETFELNSEGNCKIPYENPFNTAMKEALPMLQEFVHSFDWINSNEKIRYEKVYETLGCSYNGNTYGGEHRLEHWQILRTKQGLCEEFSDDFAALCKIVGLECVTYQPSYNHQACLIKIDEQWYAVDPTNWPKEKTIAVDYETEYNRYSNEFKNSDTYKRVMEGAELQRQAEAGEITWQEYFQITNPDMTWEELKQLYSNNGINLDEYVANLSEKW